MDMRMTFRITRTADPGKIGEQLEPKMRNLGNAMGRRAQRVVPKRSWDLHNSLKVKTERTGDIVTTHLSAGGGKVNYALYVERGTSRMKAQPYLRPALLQSRAGDLDNTAPLGRPRGA